MKKSALEEYLDVVREERDAHIETLKGEVAQLQKIYRQKVHGGVIKP